VTYPVNRDVGSARGGGRRAGQPRHNDRHAGLLHGRRRRRIDGLLGLGRIPKHHPRTEATGSLDEAAVAFSQSITMLVKASAANWR